MLIEKTLKGAFIATAVCAMFATAASAQGKEGAAAKEVKCVGINSCKGTSACAGNGNACKGQNSCKGHGWTATKTEKECTDKGGKVLAAK